MEIVSLALYVPTVSADWSDCTADTLKGLPDCWTPVSFLFVWFAPAVKLPTLVLPTRVAAVSMTHEFDTVVVRDTAVLVGVLVSFVLLAPKGVVWFTPA